MANATKIDETESDFQANLSIENKRQYIQKIAVINCIDPYLIPKSKFSRDAILLPNITSIDMINYLVLSPNPMYSQEQMRAYKGLEAHNQFSSGWVREVAVSYPKENIAVITGRVLHSQSMHETATKPWIIAEKSGIILTANCNCKAGLGGTCTHISAVLFWVEAEVRLREQKTVTQEKAYWLLPSVVQNVQYSPVSGIDFTSAKTKKKKLDSCINNAGSANISTNGSVTGGQSVNAEGKLAPPSTEEITSFFEGLNLTGTDCSILCLTEPYNIRFIPKVQRQEFPKTLTDLKRDEMCVAGYDELIKFCKSITISMSQDEANIIEKYTRDQANSKLWFRYRAGRITASRMKSACHTDIERPSASLIKAICYPDTLKFQAKATSWGCEHEKAAKEDYILERCNNHENVQVTDSGLVIDHEYPFLGASPDGVVSCDCCGTGILEIKCPWCVKSSIATEHSCLVEESPGVHRLNKRHQYYYQVQAQLFLCHKDYCDFVVWTEKGLHVETILPDNDHWQPVLQKATAFFHQVILLELVGHFYSRAPLIRSLKETQFPSTNTDSTDTIHQSATETKDGPWCYCQKGEEGQMIKCDNSRCPFQWFHFTCLNMKQPPKGKGKWYCPECRKLPKSNSNVPPAKKLKL